ncbi:MAG: hypothetical protein ACRDTM_15930 [Micromonosporaceae bacterium]
MPDEPETEQSLADAPTAEQSVADGPATESGESLGDSRVDAAVARLDAAAQQPGEQVAEYEAVHRVLQDTLATIDEA